MGVKAIFWDNDGVLVDTERIYYQANRDIFRMEFGQELSLDKFIDISLKKGKSVFELAEYNGYSKEEMDIYHQKRNERFAELLKEKNKELLINGVKPTVKKLSKSFKMGIVTSCRKEHFSIIHQSTDLLEYFDFILANGDYERSKPNPDPYLAAIAKSGFTQDECIAVEDSERGLRAAKAAGIRCIAIPNDLTNSGNFEKAYKILEKIEDLPDILLK